MVSVSCCWREAMTVVGFGLAGMLLVPEERRVVARRREGCSLVIPKFIVFISCRGPMACGLAMKLPTNLESEVELLCNAERKAPTT